MSERGRGSVRHALGEVDPAGSRHQGRRSAVALAGDTVVAGTADGTVLAVDRADGTERWRVPGEGSVVAARAAGDSVVVGTRGPNGEIRAHDAATGDVRWRHRAADDVGEPQRETRFFLPFVAALDVAGERTYAAARRYERGPDGGRRFEAVVYALDRGEVAWRHRTDASPIALAADDDRVAVAHNRCPGDHQHGLVVLDAAGDPRWAWDPGTDGQRRVGDVSLLEDGVVVASHGDYRGHRLGPGGRERWRVDLARPRAVDGETVYAYPNHVHATEAGAAFVTGNTYPEEGRETAATHPHDHTATLVDAAGEVRARHGVGGFASGVGTHGSVLAVPGAQNFRERDAADHGLTLVDVADGAVRGVDADGIVAAAAVDGEGVGHVEEPVRYHDEGERRGRYAVHVTER